MEKPKPVLLVLLSIFFLSSCDPPHFMDLLNQSATPVTVTFQLDTTDAAYSWEDAAPGEAVIIQLAPGESYTLDFGIGVWNEYTVAAMTESIHSIVIEGSNEHKTYSTPAAVEAFLLKNVEQKSHIRILIE